MEFDGLFTASREQEGVKGGGALLCLAVIKEAQSDLRIDRTKGGEASKGKDGRRMEIRRDEWVRNFCTAAEFVFDRADGGLVDYASALEWDECQVAEVREKARGYVERNEGLRSLVTAWLVNTMQRVDEIVRAGKSVYEPARQTAEMAYWVPVPKIRRLARSVLSALESRKAAHKTERERKEEQRRAEEERANRQAPLLGMVHLTEQERREARKRAAEEKAKRLEALFHSARLEPVSVGKSGEEGAPKEERQASIFATP